MRFCVCEGSIQRPKDREIRVKNEAARGRQNRAKFDFQTLKKKKLIFLILGPQKLPEIFGPSTLGPNFEAIGQKMRPLEGSKVFH